MNEKLTDQFILLKNTKDYHDKLLWAYYCLNNLASLSVKLNKEWNYSTENFEDFRVFTFTYDDELQQKLCHAYIHYNIPELVVKTIYNT